MKTIINLVLRLSGAGYVWDKLDGYKSFLMGSISILTGLAGILQELIDVISKHDYALLLGFISNLPHDQSWLMVVGGMGVIGIAHKIDKQA
jgi:hypothetical protein